MSIDTTLKTWKQALKQADATLEELESRAAVFAEMRDARAAADKDFQTAQAELEGVAFERARIKGELHEATILQDPRAEPLRDRYVELSDREQSLREQLGDTTKTIEQNTPDAGEVAELTTRLKRFRTPGTSDVVKALEAHHREHSQTAQVRVEATLSQLPTPDPRSQHEALKASDATYRTGEGATLDEFLTAEDNAGRSENATATLAARLEARDRRAVIAARK